MEQSLQRLNANQRVEIWGQRIAACRNSGMTVREWCNQEGLSEKTYYYWQHKLYRIVTEEPSFVEIPATPIPTVSDVVATIQIGHLCAAIHPGADEATMTALFRAMKSC